MEDCLKYVINEEYPAQIIDIDNYIKTMDSSDYDRNEIAIENGIGDLPEVYKKELIHRLFKIYINKASSRMLLAEKPKIIISSTNSAFRIHLMFNVLVFPWLHHA